MYAAALWAAAAAAACWRDYRGGLLLMLLLLLAPRHWCGSYQDGPAAEATGGSGVGGVLCYLFVGNTIKIKTCTHV